MKRFGPALAVALLLAFVAWSSPIKTWVSGDALTVADLNSNLFHIHSLMVGGHGARLVNADVSASAAISISKLEGSGYGVPVAYARVTCSPTCSTIHESHGLTSLTGDVVAGTVVGTITKTCVTTPTVMATAASTVLTYCRAAGASTTTFSVVCAANPGVISLVVFCK